MRYRYEYSCKFSALPAPRRVADAIKRIKFEMYTNVIDYLIQTELHNAISRVENFYIKFTHLKPRCRIFFSVHTQIHFCFIRTW